MEDNNRKPVKGIKIRTANVYMILISFILYILLIFATISASHKYRLMISAMEDYIGCEEDAALVKEGSDYLTEQVRIYTVTMDRKCVEAYFEEVNTVRRRDTALEELKNFHVGDRAMEYLQTALDNSNKLMEQEIYAMKLISAAQGYDMSEFPQEVENIVLTEEDMNLTEEEMIEKARDMVFGPVYQNGKDMVTSNISFFIDSIIDDTMKKQQDSVQNLKYTMTKQQILISILFIENVLMFFMIIILIIKPLKIYIENIEEKEKLKISGSYEFKYLALTYNNIYELNAANEAMLNYKAEHDPLTGIINRGAFDNLKQLLKVKQLPIALMIVDVDKFKEVNDGYGHETGDRVLKKVAKLLEKNFRSSDYPARIGGDEFAVILTEITAEMKSIVSDKVNGMNKELSNPNDGLPPISLSVGVAFSSVGFEDDLYKKADSALYRTKENGRCGCTFYEISEGAAV